MLRTVGDLKYFVFRKNRELTSQQKSKMILSDRFDESGLTHEAVCVSSVYLPKCYKTNYRKLRQCHKFDGLNIL
jgi:hypothetical protein